MRQRISPVPLHIGKVGEFDEYLEEGRKIVDISKLEGKFLDTELYALAHRNLVIACHDVFINYNGKILLVNRDNFPAKGHLWPIGGKLERGFYASLSLRKKAYFECNLFLTKIKFLGVDRTLFQTDPFGHKGGTDTVNLVYYAEAEDGKIKLDNLHKDPILVDHKNYPSIRPKLHSYVREYLDHLWTNGNKKIDPKKLLEMEWGLKGF